MCVFCKIINGEIPSYKIYEDDNAIAILDISQATLGHTLILPKKHYENILEIPTETLASLASTVKNVTNILQTKLNPEGFNILNNCGQAAGQTVMHFHIHIIPRYNGDDLEIKFNDHGKDFDLKALHEKLI